MSTKKPTIYEALRTKLGREPTHEEIKADVKRILEESLIEKATTGRLPHQRRRNPVSSLGYSIYARRKGSRGELMWFDGKKLTNNNRPKVFGTRGRAKSAAYSLMLKYPVLNDFDLYLGKPKALKNPQSRDDALDMAARKLQDFSGYPARKTVRTKLDIGDGTGLVIGEIRHLSYVTRREGIAGSKPVEYEHDFSKHSRPLLAVNTDGNQLYIVGGRYRFTEAGIEDR